MKRYLYQAHRHTNNNEFFCERAPTKSKRYPASVRINRHREEKPNRDEREVREFFNQLPGVLDSLESFQEND